MNCMLQKSHQCPPTSTQGQSQCKIERLGVHQASETQAQPFWVFSVGKALLRALVCSRTTLQAGPALNLGLPRESLSLRLKLSGHPYHHRRSFIFERLVSICQGQLMLKLPLCKSHMTSGSSYVGRCWNMPWRAAQSLLREGKQGISSQWYIVLPLLDSLRSWLLTAESGPLEGPFSEGWEACLLGSQRKPERKQSPSRNIADLSFTVFSFQVQNPHYQSPRESSALPITCVIMSPVLKVHLSFRFCSRLWQRPPTLFYW